MHCRCPHLSLLPLQLLLLLLTIGCRTCTLQRCSVADVDSVSFGIAQLIWTAMLGATIACQSGHYRVALLAVVWLAICRSIYGYFLAMVSDGQVHVLNEGDSVVLECSFHADGYSLFDYPVLWRKTQRGEDTPMNIMGNINEPFASTNRFEVAFTALAPRYKFELSVLDVTQVDSGNYTCEIRGPYSSILGQSTHYVYVRAPVENVVLHDSVGSSFIAASSTTTAAPPAGVRVLHMIENHLVHVRCITTGGYPPPTVELYVDRRDVTGDFALRQTSTFSGRRGLRQLTYRVERWSQSFRARTSDHNAWLKCIASVQGLAQVVESVRLNVDYSPKVICTSVEADVNDTNVCIRCEIDAKPCCSSVTWVVDNNGTSLADGQVLGGFSTVSTEQSNGILETQLCTQVVEQSSFRKYILSVENDVATVATVTQLSEKILKVAVNRSASSASSASSSSTMSRDTSRKSSFAKPSSRSVSGSRSRTTSIYWTSKRSCLLAIGSLIYGYSCYRTLFYEYRYRV